MKAFSANRYLSAKPGKDDEHSFHIVDFGKRHLGAHHPVAMEGV